MGRSVTRAVASVARVVTPIVAVVTGQPWLAALSLASNVPGPVGQAAGLASLLAGGSTLLGGPSLDAVISGGGFSQAAQQAGNAAVATRAAGVQGAIAQSLGTAPGAIARAADLGSRFTTAAGVLGAGSSVLQGERVNSADLATIGGGLSGWTTAASAADRSLEGQTSAAQAPTALSTQARPTVSSGSGRLDKGDAGVFEGTASARSGFAQVSSRFGSYHPGSYRGFG